MTFSELAQQGFELEEARRKNRLDNYALARATMPDGPESDMGGGVPAKVKAAQPYIEPYPPELAYGATLGEDGIYRYPAPKQLTMEEQQAAFALHKAQRQSPQE